MNVSIGLTVGVVNFHFLGSFWFLIINCASKPFHGSMFLLPILDFFLIEFVL
jgi:hypothetical protein